MTAERKERIDTIRVIIRRLQAEVSELSSELHNLELEQKREEHPCSCVKLNKDVEIYDMQEQVRRGRNPLSVGGFVADTLTARKDCDSCQGTGKPTKHNHFGEVFMPDTCGACKVLQMEMK